MTIQGKIGNTFFYISGSEEYENEKRWKNFLIITSSALAFTAYCCLNYALFMKKQEKDLPSRTQTIMQQYDTSRDNYLTSKSWNR